jgi:DNA polymerase III sliding clamp (beta) subunit (PCNA family)
MAADDDYSYPDGAENSDSTLSTSSSIPIRCAEGISFNLESVEAYTFKILVEFLANYTKNIQPKLSKEKFQISCADPSYSQSFMIDLYAKYFINYKCSKPMDIGINTEALNKLLKRIKKKDSISMSIPTTFDSLNIRIFQQDSPCNGTASLKIVKAQSVEIEVPTEYGDPINIKGKEFQSNMKELKDIGKIVELSFSNGRWVKFSSVEDNIYSRERIYGERDEKEEDIDSPEMLGSSSTGIVAGTFKRHYDISVFTALCKIVSLSSLVGIYVSAGLPLRMDIKVGGLGDMRVYLKSNEEINSTLDE